MFRSYASVVSSSGKTTENTEIIKNTDTIFPPLVQTNGNRVDVCSYNDSHRESAQPQARVKASRSPWDFNLYPHVRQFFPEPVDGLRGEKCVWEYPKNSNVEVLIADYTGTELIQARHQDEQTPCYSPLTDFLANIRPASWQLVSPMPRPELPTSHQPWSKKKLRRLVENTRRQCRTDCWPNRLILPTPENLPEENLPKE